MHSAKLLSAVVALGAGLVSAQTTSNLCSQPTITIKSAAEASNIPCTTVQGSIVIDASVKGEVAINGPQAISGDLIVANATELISLSSLSIGSISGKFTMQGLTLLSGLQFTSLSTVNEISWITLPALSSLTFGTVGVTKAKAIHISDTVLNSLDGLNIVSVETFKLDNNKKLLTYSSNLANVTDSLVIVANGPSAKISMPKLTLVKNMEVQDVLSFSMPLLSKAGGSIRFDKNSFQEFSAPNLTETAADFSFVNNGQLTNLTMPKLTKVTGGFTIANNTLLEKIDGFALLQTVGGGVKLRGNFTQVSLPALKKVSGAFDVQSTKDIASSCSVFDPMKPKSSGGNNVIEGKYTCASNNQQANEGTGTTTGGGSSNNTGNDAAYSGMNLHAVLGMAVLGGLAVM